MSETVRCVARHPIDLADGYRISPGETHTIDETIPYNAALLTLGFLVPDTDGGAVSPVPEPVVTLRGHLASPAAGDLVYFDGTAWRRLSRGTDGEVLHSGTADEAPSWDTVSGCFRGAYASGTAYKAGDLVTANLSLYARIADGTPTGVFNESEWTEVSASGGGAAHTIVTFDQPGTLSVATGKGRIRLPANARIISVAATVNTAPTGAAIKVDVNKNGTTVFTTQANRPTIAAGSTTSADAIPDVSSIAAGDYLSVDIDQVGSTVAGADLTVVIELLLAPGTDDAPVTLSLVIGQVSGLQAALDAKIPASIADAKGDLIVATGPDAVSRFAAGTNGQVLQADSSQASGVKWATPAVGGGGLGRFRSGRYYMAGGDFAGRGNVSQPVNGRAYLVPQWVAEDITIDRLTVEVTTPASAGGLFRLGIYDDAVGHYPGNLLIDYGTFATTASGVIGDTAGTSLVLTGGRYYWFLGAEQGGPSTGVTIRMLSGLMTGGNPIGYSGAANVNSALALLATSGFTGALPATFPAGIASTTGGPAILFKVV